MRVDIIVPVHNQWHKARPCIESLLIRISRERAKLILVNDGSNSFVSDMLENMANTHAEFITLIHHRSRYGVIRSFNTAMRRSPAEMWVLMSPDVVVPPNWIEKIVQCMKSCPHAGMASPLSTETGHTFFPMVPGTDLIRMNDILDNARIAQYPAIPEANSSCFAVTRRCVANIGFLDEMFEYVPAAITDYALSAKKNGLDVVCVDNLLVYRYDQPKSTDFSSADIQTSESILRHRWEKELKIVQKAISAPVLDDFQKRHGGMDVKPTGTPRRSLKSGDTLHILCVLPTLNPYGGVVSVLNLLNCLMQKGHLCTLVSLSKPQTLPQPFYAQPVSQTEWGDIHKTMNGTYDILLATSWETAEPIAKLAESGCGFPYYFIQGIEQVFYPPEDIRRQAVRDTYSRIDIKFVKTYYLQNAFRDMGFDVHKIRPGMNLDMFYPYGKPDDDILRLLAMVRLGHAYRGDDLVFATLEKIKVLKPDVEIILFGSNELSKLEVPFPFVDMGRVSPDALPPIYSKADVYMDLSREHGFGRTGVEAMACGTACVLSESGGISDYARHQDNALIVPVEDTDAATAAVIRLLEDKELRFHLIQNGLETVKGFDDRDAAEDFLQVVYRTHPAFRQ